MKTKSTTHLQVSRLWYIKSALGYIEKKVKVGVGDPEISRSDAASINYVSLPLLVGMNIKSESSRFNLWMELGPNLRIAIEKASDAYYWMPKTMGQVVSLNAGTGAKVALSPKLNSLLAYNFIYDLSNAIEYRDRKTHYKFRSHVVNIGLQYIIK